MKFLFLLLSLSSTCMAAEIHEADLDPRYVEILGKTFLTKSEFAIHDLSKQDSAENASPLYIVTGMPGMDGWEIRSRNALPINTIIRVDAIYSCPLCSLLRSEGLIITLVGDEKYENARIEVRETRKLDVLLYENKKATLNPDFFELQQ